MKRIKKKIKSEVIAIFKNRINKINDDTFNIKTIIYLIQMHSIM